MKIRILGSAAGGGFPQWNCNAPLSRAVRENRPGFLVRTQSSIAASADGESWAIFNASPDIRTQIAASPDLQPRGDGPLRHTPIKTVVLTNADVDHIAGLLSLREREPFVLYATARVLRTLADNSIFQVLAADVVERRELPLSGITGLEGPDGPIGLTVETFAVPGKVALFLESEDGENFGTADGDTIGVALHEDSLNSSGGKLFYIPGCAAVDETLRRRIDGSDCLMFDGTVFHDTEMADTGVGTKTGARMGHMAIGGPNGSLEALKPVELGRRIFVHINNTNPILDPQSDAANTVREAGWEIGYDGMEITL
ncbi:pyrroloquinoline quinone biosynthesis protein PqqB [Roseibium aggregatum]|uniref:Coenzyme PQQ synthesis protein B n=1 Tax=Roseibium aggregatum TaxID=187304 RepID=A0A939J492_9HYPH|nr:pyrroloquinoline quinone biosynthesis protein PqqB [Roseibium aggregatum]MBN9673318.1 pyrroloquinoline quinone biosynthesis protein PqqB [Roseibium aggregatum]